MDINRDIKMMTTKMNKQRRQVLVWSAPTIAAVSLPAHAEMSVASFTLSKELTGGPNPATSEGDVLEYTIVVENTGTVDITGLVVTDTLPDGTVVTLSDPMEDMTSDGVLEVAETWTYASSYTVTFEDLVAGDELVNTVSATADQVMGSLEADATASVTMLRACSAPPIVSVPDTPKCAGDPPIGTALIEIVAPDDIPMELISITVETSDPGSTIDDLPSFPAMLSETTPVEVSWNGPASDALVCLPTAQIDMIVEYACENGEVLTETYNITGLLIDAVAAA